MKYPEYPSVSMPVLLLFCSYVIIWYLQIGSRISWLGAIRIELIVACLLMPLALSVNSRSKTRIDSPLIPLTISYFILLLVMTVFSYDFQTSWYIFLNRVVKFAFMALFIVCFVKSPTGMRFFLAAFMLACMKMGQEGLVGQLTGGLVWQNQGVMRLHGSTLMYRHPNSFSGMALGTLPFVLYFFPIVNKWIKTLLLVQLVFALNIILHTGSRTGYIGFIGVILVAYFRSKHKLKLFLVLIIGVLLVAKFAPEQYVDRFRSIYTSSDTVDLQEGEVLHGEGSKQARIQILRDAKEIFLSHPWGIGVAAFPSIRMDTFGRGQDTHNLYFEIATNLGLQGIVFFAFYMYFLFKCLLENRKTLKVDLDSICNEIIDDVDSVNIQKITIHCNDLRLLIAVCDSVILFISLRLFLGLFGMDVYEIYWWFSIGIALSVTEIVKVAHSRTLYFQQVGNEGNCLLV